MAQDRSRSAFDYRQLKHWSSLQAQQGRLLSDDDWNEADAIDKEDIRLTRVDVIGPDGSPDDGFQLSNPQFSASGVDFDLAPGTMYAGGLRTTLEQTESFSLQKDWLQQTASDRAPLGNADRIDLVYLEVWQQPVTAVEDTELREVALGGPDTSVRIRTMRRVRLLAAVGTEDCTDAWKKLTPLGLGNELAIDATLKVNYVPDSVTPNLCNPSAQGGYLGAENQAIRVEIRSANSFLWGYDNASPLYGVQLTKDSSGNPIIHFLQAPKDEAHWPLANQIVEILPWSAVLPNGEKVAEYTGGHLATVSASYDPDTQNIAVSPVVPTNFGTQWQQRSDHASLGDSTNSFYYLRVWNRGADTTSSTEISFNSGDTKTLIGTGLQITLTGTNFRPGDYWIIAARPESPQAVVPWSLEKGKLAEGVRRFYAVLGIIHWRPSSGNHTVFDCRHLFDPLTQQRGCCVQISPHSGWEHIIDEVSHEDDLCICFQPGDFVTNRTLVLNNKHVTIKGAGAASRVQGAGLETVFLFDGCSFVHVHDMCVQSTAQFQQGKAATKPHLAGAITIRNCDQASVSRVVVRNASGPMRSTSCVILYNDFSSDRISASVARVRDCEFVVGAHQVGLSIVNFGRSTVEDNNLHVDVAENSAIPPQWLQLREFRRGFRRVLLWGYGVEGDTNPPANASIANLTAGDKKVWISTAKELVTGWNKLVTLRKFHPKVVNHRSVGEFLNELAEDVVYASGSLGNHPIGEFKSFMANVLALRTAITKVRTVAAQGIVIAGIRAQEVRLIGNTARDFTQGIHVGVSQARPRGVTGGTPDVAGRIVIANNSLYISLMPESVVERHGIFVGNCQSLLIESNKLECEVLGSAKRSKIDGIRIYGFLGSMAYVTQNHVVGFSTGIRIAPLNNKTDGSKSMWRVTENMAQGSAITVDNTLKIGKANFVVISSNLP